jgi:teichuronic acid biosynthesis glycosyltransferase TuaC
VLLEAMACGLPVVTTRVGGNPEVVSDPALGILAPFWDEAAFLDAVIRALEQDWDREAIARHAQANAWDRRVDQLIGIFERISAQRAIQDGKGNTE